MRARRRHGRLRSYVPAESVEEQWDIAGLEQALAAELQLDAAVSKWLEAEPNLDDDDLRERIVEAADAAYRRRR